MSNKPARLYDEFDEACAVVTGALRHDRSEVIYL